MVQYIHTPWRDRAELLQVRRQFYPSPPGTDATITSNPASASYTTTTTTTTNFAAASAPPHAREPRRDDQEAEAGQRHAVSRVSVWVQRGSCPHMVESTGLLMAAILDDLHEARMGSNSSTSAIRLAYSAAFSRFVTGLLDSHQDKQQKQSMYSIAKTIGLPATFVELRHQCTHEQLPSLLKLRSAAQKSLVWIWHYYWKHLSEDEGTGDGGSSGGGLEESSCGGLLFKYLTTEEPAAKRDLEQRLKQWDDETLLRTLTEVGESAQDPRVLMRSLQFSQQILDGKLGLSPEAQAQDDSGLVQMKDLEAIQAEMRRVDSNLENLEPVAPSSAGPEKDAEPPSQTKGWSRYQGTWKPKPIGVI